MAIYHLSVKPVQRSHGRSATAASAYRSGKKIKDERTGEEYDYTQKQGVLHTELIFPSGEHMSREDLWNAAEAAERRKDGTTAREYELALPAELTEKSRQELAHEFGQMLVKRHNVAVDISIHAPSKGGDQRNYHVHILATTRCMEGGKLTRKSDFDLSDRDRGKKGLKPRRAELESIREAWARMVNKSLDLARSLERVTHRSYKDRGLEIEPTRHLGPIATAMERRGVETERGNLNRSLTQGKKMQDELEALERQDAGIKRFKEQARKWNRDNQLELDRVARERELERQAELERQQEERKRKIEAERAAREEQRQKSPQRSRSRGIGR